MPRTHDYPAAGFRSIRCGKICGLRSGIGTTGYDTRPLLGPLPTSGALPFTFQDPFAVQSSCSQPTRLPYHERIDSIQGSGEENSGHAASVGEVEEVIFGGCWAKQRTRRRPYSCRSKFKRFEGVFPFTACAIISSSSSSARANTFRHA